MNPLMQRHLQRHLGILLGVTTLCCLFVSVRLAHRGGWLPTEPSNIGYWTEAAHPIPDTTLAGLGDPPAFGGDYTNPFNQHVVFYVIAPNSFAAYHEPTQLTPAFGYQTTADKDLPLFSGGPVVHAQILRSVENKQRVLMYYWLQHKDGVVGKLDDLSDTHQITGRLEAGWNAAWNDSEGSIVRAYIQIRPADTLGLESRRSLNEVCRGLYESFKKDGARP